MSSLHIYYFVCRGHSWRVRLAKQETLTPPWHLVSPLVCRGPWMSPWCSIVGATVTVHQFFCILHSVPFHNLSRFESHSNLQTLSYNKYILIEIVILWVYYTIPFGFNLKLFLALFGHYFSTFYTTCLAKDQWWGFSARNSHMVGPSITLIYSE